MSVQVTGFGWECGYLGEVRLMLAKLPLRCELCESFSTPVLESNVGWAANYML
jgi:hypothetical protein